MQYRQLVQLFVTQNEKSKQKQIIFVLALHQSNMGEHCIIEITGRLNQDPGDHAYCLVELKMLCKQQIDCI